MTKKKNMRNEFEFMSAVLDALGVQYKEADVKVRERWRGKVLDGWGVSYIPDDLKQFERWRKNVSRVFQKTAVTVAQGCYVTKCSMGGYF